MKFSVNEKVRNFFLGDDKAWEEVLDEIHDETAKKLQRQFRNMPEYELYVCFVDWQSEFYVKVKMAQAEAAEKARAISANLSAAEFENLTVECCEDSTKFRLARETPFKSWVWRIVFNRVVDRFRELRKIIDPETPQVLNLVAKTHNIEDNLYAEASDADLVLHFILLKNIIISALDDDELLYFEIWLDKGHDPSGREVIEIFKQENETIINDFAVTRLKQRFLAKSYLALQEVRYSAEATLTVFANRFLKSAETQNIIHTLMLERLWQVFSDDEKAVAASKNKISRRLWLKLDKATFTSGLQTEILVAAYRYFRRAAAPRPVFCQTVEIFAADKFGNQIKELFTN